MFLRGRGRCFPPLAVAAQRLPPTPRGRRLFPLTRRSESLFYLLITNASPYLLPSQGRWHRGGGTAAAFQRFRGPGSPEKDRTNRRRPHAPSVSYSERGCWVCSLLPLPLFAPHDILLPRPPCAPREVRNRPRLPSGPPEAKGWPATRQGRRGSRSWTGAASAATSGAEWGRGLFPFARRRSHR